MTHQIDPIAFASVIDDMHVRLARAHQENQRLIHEAERHVCQPGRIFAVQVRCDGKGCSSLVAFDPAPEEAALTKAIMALGWGIAGERYYCKGCL